MTAPPPEAPVNPHDPPDRPRNRRGVRARQLPRGDRPRPRPPALFAVRVLPAVAFDGVTHASYRDGKPSRADPDELLGRVSDHVEPMTGDDWRRLRDGEFTLTFNGVPLRGVRSLTYDPGDADTRPDRVAAGGHVRPGGASGAGEPSRPLNPPPTTGETA